MKSYKSIFIIISLCFLIIMGLQILEPSFGEKLSSIFTTITTIIGFVSVFYEMKRSADIDECNFILETYKHFTNSDDSSISRIYKKLDMLFCEKENKLHSNDRNDIVQYLQFFELLANLIEKDSISIQDIDRLYGYAFFIATNCKFIQEIELIPSKDYYEGIYNIYPKWKSYRQLKNKAIPFEETPLIK